MKKIIFCLMFVSAMLFQLASAMAEKTPEELCNIKNIKCSDLNYEDTYNAGATCTPCPIVSENKYSCISRLWYSLSPLSVEIKQAGAKVCEKLPSCADLGYQITKENAAKVSTIYSCSACPLDGNMWACARYGLKK